MSSGLNIAALARRTGVAPDTLRKWEQRYGILRPTRTEGGQRRYSEHDVDRVVWLTARLAEGYRIGEAASLLGVESDATAATSEELAELVLAAARRSDGAAVNRLLDHAFSTDLDATCAEVVMPLLVAVGESWHAGGITIAQEHLVTSAVRARLERRLAEVRAAVHGRAVLACAPGERHELGLLMLAIRLRADGWDVTYLGQDMPVADTLAMAIEMGATIACFSIGTAEAAAALEAGLKDAPRPRSLTIVIGGRAANPVIAARAGALHAGAALGDLVASLRSSQPAQLAG